ncbi:glycosyltransferase [Cellulomonas sp. H30R-01]|uniref:glycosyltransferase n=1 Tax=Cellulomonas sp. H30R-01 TaxID=2704467 RepID=UPI00138D90ED|nr:glycosyltransferase [Cellulomonas sp. H30R-01]QHT57280.1 glycosyltransferase [Cellulomonas sp. H30R-01]
MSVRHVAVVIPARDEEDLVGRCLASVSAAARRLPSDVTVDVVVVLDGCVDGTADVVACFPAVRTVVTRGGNVGRARAAGVRAALGQVRGDLADVWVACTDADSEVPEGWLTDHVRLADAGADVVVGTVRPDPRDLLADEVVQWQGTRVPGRPNGHVHGANLGVRASAYVAAGGFAPRREHEDVGLVAALHAAGARIVASDVVDVLTSGRREGRSPGGYAGYLTSRFPRAASTGADVHEPVLDPVGADVPATSRVTEPATLLVAAD